MKKFTIVLIIAAGLALITGCNGNQRSPEAVAKDFCEELFVKKNYKNAMDHSTGAAREALALASDLHRTNPDMAQMRDDFEDNLKIDYRIQNAEVSGDRANVTVLLTSRHPDMGSYDSEERLGLVRENGKWYVSDF